VKTPLVFLRKMRTWGFLLAWLSCKAKHVQEQTECETSESKTEKGMGLGMLLQQGSKEKSLNLGVDGQGKCVGNCPFCKPHDDINEGNPHKDMPLCTDGEYHWACASGGHGPRVQCPSVAPVMCAYKRCDGDMDHCCEVDCGAVGSEPFGGPRMCKVDHLRITCPFLSTLIHEGDLHVKDSYTAKELMDITIAAGLDADSAKGHIAANFKDIPSNEIDIFNMEGLPNEHFSSTGINDCNSCVFKCRKHKDGHQECQTTTPNKTCGVPSQQRFDEFFQIADSNGDGVLTATELKSSEDDLPENDFNPIGDGTIVKSFQALIDIFGVPPKMKISRDALKTINVDRRYPATFTFPSTDNTRLTPSPQKHQAEPGPDQSAQ